MNEDSDGPNVISIRFDQNLDYGHQRGTMMVFEFQPGFFEASRAPKISPALMMEAFSSYLPFDSRSKTPEYILHLPWRRAVNPQEPSAGLKKDLCTYSFDGPADAHEISEEIEMMLGGLRRNNTLPDSIRLIGVNTAHINEINEILSNLRLDNIELQITLPEGFEYDRPAPYSH